MAELQAVQADITTLQVDAIVNAANNTIGGSSAGQGNVISGNVGSGIRVTGAGAIGTIILGVILGHFWPQTGAAMKPLGDGFIKLIKMIIAPIIFCTVVVGIAGMEDMKRVGKTGGYALLYFEKRPVVCTSTTHSAPHASAAMKPAITRGRIGTRMTEGYLPLAGLASGICGDDVPSHDRMRSCRR